MLYDLSAAAGLEEKRSRLSMGQHINSTEDRAVMHIALRAPANKAFNVDGKNVTIDVHSVLDKIQGVSEAIRSQRWLGATGKALTTVVSVGIGGSYLGPEFVYESLRADATASQGAAGRVLKFIANVDPVDAHRVLEGLNPEQVCPAPPCCYCHESGCYLREECHSACSGCCERWPHTRARCASCPVDGHCNTSTSPFPRCYCLMGGYVCCEDLREDPFSACWPHTPDARALGEFTQPTAAIALPLPRALPCLAF